MHNDSTLVEENQRFVRKGLINIIKSLSKQLEQVTRERDAAVNSLKRYAACDDCKCFSELNCNERSDFLPCYVACCDQKCPCGTCKYGSNWQWRGVEVEG